MPAIVARHPNALYVIAGQTHPEVAKLHGEEYRISLERLARDLDLSDHVVFDDRFLTIEDLSSMLAATTIYLTPYRSREQIVSGALTFAIVAGCPTVSTPYFYAEDLLAAGGGISCRSTIPPALAEAVIGLLDEPERLEQDAHRGPGNRQGSSPGRRSAGRRRMSCAKRWPSGGRSGARHPQPATLPRARASHLLTMVDDVGIVRRGRHRAAALVGLLHRRRGAPGDRRNGIGPDHGRRGATGGMLARSLGFLRHAWSAERGGMHNFMSYDRRWLDEPHGGDHFARAAWALGEVVAADPVVALLEPSLILLREMLAALAEQRWPRSARLRRDRAGPSRPGGGRRRCRGRPARTRHTACRQPRANASPDWYWAEDALTYDNARLPQALIAAGTRLGEEELVSEGIRSLDWYATELGIDGDHLQLAGHRGRRRGQPRGGEGDEQPLDAAALVEAEVEAFLATRDERHARRCGSRVRMVPGPQSPPAVGL